MGPPYYGERPKILYNSSTHKYVIYIKMRQKEKLAYTVLAASLAYQFGLERGASRTRALRFVVIDEAFGRGSDESARYGLELFERVGLQLLIVTPLQKIHIIEPHVASVGFVHNEEGRCSMLRNLTIEEYRAEKIARSA